MKRVVAILFVLSALTGGNLDAQAQDSTEIAEIKAQIDALTREIERLQLGQEVTVEADTAVLGFAPAASKVYRVQRGVSLGGYGEVLYQRFASSREDGSPAGKNDQIDMLRGVLYAGYKFNNRFLFNSELEVEHSATGHAGSVGLEFAYLDYRLSDPIGFRGGLLLVPMGLVNELHEPTAFLGTDRPLTERSIIPTTWREAGIGMFGEAGGFSYRTYLLNSFDAIGGGSSKASGFSASGLRGGRQKGSKAVANDFAWTGRLDYVGQPWLMVGSSIWIGQTGQNRIPAADPASSIGARTLIWEGHADARYKGFVLRGLVAVGAVSDAAALNAEKDLSDAESIGERLFGWYLEAGYDVLRSLSTTHQLLPYVRYEQVNTQDRVPAGFSSDPANNQTILLLGGAWKPIPNLVVKADYQFRQNAAQTGTDQFNILLGYVF
jgi:hypothetical protein